MIIFISCIFLFVMQIIYLVKSIKNSNYNNWSKLFFTIISSAIFLIVSLLYVFNTPYSQGWDPLLDVIFIVLAGIVFFIILIISIITAITKNKKEKIKSTMQKEDKNSITKYALILSAIIICLLSIKLIPPILKMGVAKDEAIKYLEEKYGNGNYKIVKAETANVCDGCSMFSYENGYEITVKSKYLDKNTIVTVSDGNFKVLHDDLLDNYFKEKYNTNRLDDYVTEYEIDKINSELKKHFNATIKFNDSYLDMEENKKYGKLPTIEDLSKYVKLEDPKIEIHEDIKTEKELLTYLKKLTKYFINDLDKSKISYERETEYFRYKYNYRKLGVKNYTDQYHGYGGYVYAGDYIPSKEGGYKPINKDKIIRINIMGKVTEFSKEDIIK